MRITTTLPAPAPEPRPEPRPHPDDYANPETGARQVIDGNGWQ